MANALQTDSMRALLGGMGDPARDKAAGAYYATSSMSDDQLLNAYTGTWLSPKIVDIPAMDAIRKGREWQADNKQIEAIEAEEKRLGFWKKLLQVQIKARLFGGAAIYIATDDDPNKPFRPEKVGKGGINYLTVLSRREIVAGKLDQDTLSETYGNPVDYQVMGGSSFATVHPSRLAIFVGNEHPDPWVVNGNGAGWGDSVLQSVFDAVKNADSTAANIASLVFEANVDVFGIPGFMASMADPQYREQFITRATLAATNKSNNKSLLMDAEETYDRKQISFANLPETLQQFLQIVSGASDIPATRLLGMSPAGMNATGSSDERNYFNRIEAIQALDVQPAIYRLDEALIRSALGDRPAEIHYNWAPLGQLTEKEKADIGKIKAEAAKIDAESGLIPPPVLAKSRFNQVVEDGLYPGIEAAAEEFKEYIPGDKPNPEVEGEEDEA